VQLLHLVGFIANKFVQLLHLVGFIANKFVQLLHLVGFITNKLAPRITRQFGYKHTIWQNAVSTKEMLILIFP